MTALDQRSAIPPTSAKLRNRMAREEGIRGLITQYGGANSHMAIRAAEMGLPAAIGVGTALYESLAGMDAIELDCKNQTIRKLQ